MDYKQPKTRQELKGKKGKEGKGVYNQKSIRLQEALIEKNKTNLKNNKDTNKKWINLYCLEILLFKIQTQTLLVPSYLFSFSQTSCF